MLRLKVPSGILHSSQLRLIAKIAQQQCRAFADITTRQDIQLHWVKTQDIAGILSDLQSAGISTLGPSGDTLRNVVGCPVAGVDAREFFDATPVLRQVSDHFIGSPEFSDLPRKYKLSISACRWQCCQPEIHCVSFVGTERRGFDVRVGGGLSTQWYFAERLNTFVLPEQVLPVFRAITEIWKDSPEYCKDRSRARLKYLIADWGAERFREALQERLDFQLQESGPLEDPEDAYGDHAGVHEQKQPGLFYIGVPVLVGRITSDQMKKTADIAERHGDGAIRLTVRQNLLLLNIPQEKVPLVLEGLEAVGLKAGGSPFQRGTVTCTGTEFCNLAVAETKARSREIMEHLEKRVLLQEPLRIHISGCPSACAQSPIAHIGLQGSADESYDIAIGGQLGRDRVFNHFVVRNVPAAEVKFRLERLLLEYCRARKPGEKFNEFCRRVGDPAVARLLTPEPAVSS